MQEPQDRAQVPPAVAEVFHRAKVAQQLAEEQVTELVVQLETQVADLEREKAELLASSPLNGLNHPVLRDALVGAAVAGSQEWVPDMLGTVGSGPWETAEFDDFLSTRDFVLRVFPHEGLEAVVLGRHGWTEADLSKQLYLWDGAPARIYTQELFVLGMAIAADPLVVLTEQQLLAVSGDHPAIAYLRAQNFAWPMRPALPPGGDSVQAWADEDLFHQSSPLRLLGYSVARGKWTAAQRRGFLRQAMQTEVLPGLDVPEAQSRWGVAYSAQRLYAISSHLFWLVRFQGPDKPAAREKWVADLTWLKQNFYRRSQGFRWPYVSEAVPVATARAPTGLHKLVTPSSALAAIVGHGPMSRQDITVKVWAYIKANKLQDPENPRMIVPDASLSAVLGPHKVNMFGMTRLIVDHVVG